MKLAMTIDKIGLQKNIKQDKEIEERIRVKTLKYLSKQNK